MVTGVDESKTGTITSTEEQAKVTPSTEVKTPETASKVSPEVTPKLYSKDEADALVHAAKSEGGRETRIVEKERDALKTQLAAITSERDDIKTEREGLDKRITELSSSDPELNNLEKRAKELREQDRTLKDGIRSLEADRLTNATRVKKADDFERGLSLQVIVEEYEDGDLTKLTDLCDTFEAKSEDQIRKVAETLWLKKVFPPPVLYSGKTIGGGIDPKTLSPEARTSYYLNKLSNK